MKTKAYYQAAVGLDVGTSHVRCVIGVQEDEATPPAILGVGEAANNGVRKGVVADIEETVTAISEAVNEATRTAGVNAAHASVGVNGNHLIAVTSHGIIAVAASAREITTADIDRVEDASSIMQLPPNREIIQSFPRNYLIDGQESIKEPVGMSGMRLEVDTTLVTAATPFLKNLGRATSQAGVRADNLVANPLAAASVVVDRQHREQGAVLIDIGAATTGMAVFEEGYLLHTAVLPIGSNHITSDLAIGLRTEIEVAEKVKLEHVTGDPAASRAVNDRNVKLKEPGGHELIASLRDINGIAQARLEEIFNLVNGELRKIKREGMLAGGAVLCGGGAKLKAIEEFAKASLRLPARVGKPHGFSGIADKINDPAFAVALGLMVEDLHTTPAGGAMTSVIDTAKGVFGGLVKRFRKP